MKKYHCLKQTIKRDANDNPVAYRYASVLVTCEPGAKYLTSKPTKSGLTTVSAI